MTIPEQGTIVSPGICSAVERPGSPRSRLIENRKVVQHLGRISRIRWWVITTLLSALVLLPAVAVAQAPPTHFDALHRFHGGDGYAPFGNVTLDAAGNLYGGTFIGGDFNCSINTNGCGVVFELNTTGKEKVLHKFTGKDDGGGALEGGNLARDSQGRLYGQTAYGGDFSCSSVGCGTVFKVDTAGKVTVLHAFTGSNGDGAFAIGNVILDQDGNLYGTTRNGGDLSLAAVPAMERYYKIDTAGKETMLYSFLGAQ